MNRTNKHFGACGFTIVELLVTLVIIGIVLSLMLPAFSAVKNAALVLQQKGQHNLIETGLEGFRLDFGDYPDDYHTNPYSMVPYDYSDRYSGAQILAEAMVGRDGFGVHKYTQFLLEDGIDTTDDGVGDTKIYGLSPVNKSLRRGPYIEPESANATMVGSLYSNLSDPLDADTYVLSDMFGKVKNKVTGKPSGMPVLYYKANTSNSLHVTPSGGPGGQWGLQRGYEDSIYTLYVNSKVFDWGIPFKSNYSSHMYTSSNSSDWSLFYEATRDPNFNTPVRPYRSESFILQSAGLDGIYGTMDDVYNFEENN